MKIGFDAKRAFWNNTGLGNYSRFIASGFSHFTLGHTIYLYSPGLPVHKELVELDGLPNIHKIDLGSGLFGNIKRSVGFQFDRLDIFHGLSNELPFFISNSKAKLVVSIHDLLFLRFPNFYPFVDRQIYRFKTKRACEKADLVIAISEQTKQDLIHFLGVPESKIKVHYQSCHPQFWDNYSEAEIDSNRQKYGISKPYILQVGTLENRKNALFTLEAFAKSKSKESFQLVLLGKKTPYCDVLYDFVSKNDLQEKVLFVHKSDFADFPLFYQGASLSVYPSLFEGFGIPVLEAMCCGVPVITSQDGCFSEVGGEAAIYIDPKDAAQLQFQLDKVLSNESFRLGLIEKGNMQAQKFSAKKLIGELEAIYSDLLKS